MGYQVFPQPSTSGASLPPGADSLVIKGLANKSGFTYTSSTLSSGVKIVYANPFVSGRMFVINAPNSGKAFLQSGLTYGGVNLTTSEANLSIVDVSNSALSMNWTSSIGRAGVVFSTSTGYLAVRLGNNGGREAVMFTTNFTNFSTRFLFASSTSEERGSGVVFGNGRYVAAIGKTGIGYAFSTDGINWASRASTYGQSNSFLNFNGNFFGFISTNQINVSTDGLNWTSSALFWGVNPHKIAGGGGYFGVPANEETNLRNYIYFGQSTSFSGVVAPGPSTTTGGYQSIAYGNGIWVAAGYDSSRYASLAVTTNRTTWTLVRPFGNVDNGTNAGYVYFGNGVFFVNWNSTASNFGKLISVDGITWTTVGLPSGTNSTLLAVDPVLVDGNRMAYTLFEPNSGAAAVLNLGGTPTYYELYNGSTEVIN